MAEYKESVEVEVPLQTAYNQWTQFEDFPQFMDGVESVTQLDDTHLQWVAEIAGQRREWQAEIYDQRPDEQICWRATEGQWHGGIVRFEPLGADRTRVTLTMTYEPQGAMEKVGDALGIVESKVRGDLKRFKDFIESRGRETGAWRGEV